ncbi:MAG TPA: FAD-dependent oxidoreductase, partial [Phycisphaerales bacterium]|nr:FAD-dependent oxidoreductase [Phycisphaerales bacterium]
MQNAEFDVVVIGGGHAGAEAAWAAANALGADGKVALVTMDPAKIGVMSCNPAIGGLAKGQMVREIDALGGLMGLATDATGILFKMLNTSKGAAVRGPRAQCDKYAYSAEVQRLISTRENMAVIAGTVDEIVVEDGKVAGVRLPAGSRVVCADREQADRNVRNEGLARAIYRADGTMNSGASAGGWMIRTKAVVLTTGTFMRALMHTGEQKTEGGRVNEGSAVGISGALRGMGFALGRLKTGTPPRLARESIDWENLPMQRGDEPAVAFSDLSPGALPREKFPQMPQAECRMSRTTAEIHEVIKANIHRAPMYSGQIDAECGPRYCPSIEDKV